MGQSWLQSAVFVPVSAACNLEIVIPLVLLIHIRCSMKLFDANNLLFSCCH
jgi:hypothetical protein